MPRINFIKPRSGTFPRLEEPEEVKNSYVMAGWKNRPVEPFVAVVPDQTDAVASGFLYIVEGDDWIAIGDVARIRVSDGKVLIKVRGEADPCTVADFRDDHKATEYRIELARLIAEARKQR